ncbi:MAG: chromosome segregation protein SMC, partial [Gemmatimonadetes bacterium]|nr:chromosome segregation protein SMC [Gemmatimonadota bacterium]
MKLTRLELSGFKSFADKTQLTFEDGITSIVGPNGCGKSNISDAVRWVLGEQRARMLRGARMEDIIFQGTAKRKPLNVAEISLCLDNSDNTLPVAYREVVITRRLARNGQSDYLLNKQPMRLRDIQDLLRGSGLGGEGGVVIEAQNIDRLLSDRPDERRMLFEEAAGISLYRDRKTTTERRLEKTLEDLHRLDDVISEIQTQVRSLARQRGKAERHHQLTEKRFGIVITLAQRSLQQFEQLDRTLRGRKTDIADELPESRTRLSEMEQERERRVQGRATAEAQRTDVERRLGEQRLEVSKLKGDLELAGERLKHATDRKARAQEERAGADSRAKQAAREREAAAEERSAASKARQSVQTELNLRAGDEQEVRDRVASQYDRARELEDSLQQQAERDRALAGENEALERDLGDLRTQVQKAEQRRKEAGAARQEAGGRLQSAGTELDKRQLADDQTSAELDRSRHALAAAKEKEAAVLVERRSAEERTAGLGVRRAALEALEHNREGLAPAARKLLADQERFGKGAVLGPLTDYLHLSAEGAPVAEQMLAEWLQAVLVKNEATVNKIRLWHEETQPGPLVLLPVHPGPARHAKNVPKLDLEIDDPAREWTNVLLAGNASLDDGGHAIRRSNGAVFLPGGEDSGPLRRRAELDELVGALESAQQDVERLEAAADEASRELAAAERALEEAGGSAEATGEALREIKGHSADCEREMQRADRELHESEEAFSRFSERMEQRTIRLEEVRRELQSLESGRAQSEAELERQRSLLKSLETDKEAARENRVHWQVEEAQVSVREEAAREREERADETYKTAFQEMENLDRELAAIESSTEGAVAHRTQWTDQLADRRAEVTELEAATVEAGKSVAAADAALATMEEELEHSRQTVQRLGDELHNVELEYTEIAGRRNAIIERIEAEWHRPLAELLEAALDVEGDDESLRAEAERLEEKIQATGLVNPLAAQEYEEERKRLEFLETQREDLAEARASLQQALKEIDNTARALFTETFDGIRENFKKVFLTLFDVGDCDVRLADEHDPLGSDIEIRAAPRGKRTQRIHLLSSGERALVAISLLFAIYLTKPSPFCLLDEVDAPLDDSNVQRFLRLLTEFKSQTQFIVITHNPRTMQTADAVYGVTMQEPGVSSIVGVRLGEHAAAV